MEFAFTLQPPDSTRLRDTLAAAHRDGWLRFVVDNSFLENSLLDRDSVSAIRAALAEFDAGIAASTLPLSSRFDITCRDGDTRMSAVCHIANFMYAAKTLGIPTIVLSVSPSLPSPHGNDTRSALRALEGLVETAEIMKINLAVKNLLDSLSRSTLDAALSEYQSPNFGLCYNVAFDYLAGDEPLRLLDRYGNRLKLIQLSDCDGATTTRLPIGAGVVDWIELGRRIRLCDYNGVVHLETIDGSDESTASSFESLASSRDKLMEFLRG